MNSLFTKNLLFLKIILPSLFVLIVGASFATVSVASTQGGAIAQADAAAASCSSYQLEAQGYVTYDQTQGGWYIASHVSSGEYFAVLFQRWRCSSDGGQHCAATAYETETVTIDFYAYDSNWNLKGSTSAHGKIKQGPHLNTPGQSLNTNTIHGGYSHYTCDITIGSAYAGYI